MYKARTSFPPLKWHFSIASLLTGKNLLLPLVVPDDFANHFISPGHKTFCSPALILSINGFMFSYVLRGVASWKSETDSMELYLCVLPHSVPTALSINWIKLSFWIWSGYLRISSICVTLLKFSQLTIEVISGISGIVYWE